MLVLSRFAPVQEKLLHCMAVRDYLARQLSDATQSIALAGLTFKPFNYRCFRAGNSIDIDVERRFTAKFDDAGTI